MDDQKKLIDDFHEAMLELYRKALAERDYDGTIFYKMIMEVGGLQTANRLLQRNANSYGFEKLALENNRPDLTVEYLVLQSPWSILFEPKELQVARERLRIPSS